MRIFHGTDVNSAIDILTNGFYDTDRIWEPSVNDTFYAWSADYVQKFDGDKDDTEEETKERTISNAIESGQVKCALGESNHVIVLEFEIDDCYVSPDSSEDNMLESGAAEISLADMNKHAKLIHIYCSFFPQKLSLFFVPWHNDSIILPNSLESYREFMTNKRNDFSGIYDSLYEYAYDYRTITEKDLLKLN